MTDVFISYSHKDGEYAHQLAADLRRQGLDVWIDDRIDYGDRWPRVIQDNLSACRLFVVIMSTNAFNSAWVQNEVSYAQDNEKIIFPLLLEGKVWLSLASMQYVDVRGGLLPPAKFADKLKKALGHPVTPATEPNLKMPPRRQARPWGMIALGGLLAVCVLAGVVWAVIRQTTGTGQSLGEVAVEPTEAPTKHPPTKAPPTDVPPTDVPPPSEVQPTDIPPTDIPPTLPPTEDPFAGEFNSRDFHLAVGDVRTYKYGLQSGGASGMTQQLGDVTERVVALEGDSNEVMQVFRVERNGYMIGLDCPTEGGFQVFWYIRDDTRIYTACSEDERTATVEALLQERLFFNPEPQGVLATPAYLFPIAVNAKWAEWSDVPVSEDTRYVWFVDSQLQERTTLAGTFRNCYEVALRTNPDVTFHYLCKGIGLVAWFYHHNGTVDDYIAELSSYSFAP